MKAFTFGFILCGLMALAVHAEPEPEPKPAPSPAKGLRSVFGENIPRFRSAMPDMDNDELDIGDVADDADTNNKDTSNGMKGDTSSGRLFLQKFLLFRNIFGSSSTQPVIPIIITGASSTNTATNPTTITSTGTVPTATGTITTTPTAKANNRRGYDDDDEEPEMAYDDEAAAVDEQALQAALVAGAQEYVVTDDEIKGTSDSKMPQQQQQQQQQQQPNRINLRRKNGRKGQVISVRIPPQYRRYFKSGQKVMLNAQGQQRPNKRRVFKKRITNNNNRRRLNKNQNKRIISV